MLVFVLYDPDFSYIYYCAQPNHMCIVGPAHLLKAGYDNYCLGNNDMSKKLFNSKHPYLPSGQDNQKDCSAYGVLRVQVQEAASHQEMQAL